MKTDRLNILSLVLIFGMAFTACEIYPLEDPSFDNRDQYTGVWTCTEYSEESNAFTYPVNIEKDPLDANRLILENFGFIGFDEKAPLAILSGSFISISEQEVCDDNSMIISGNGEIINKQTIKWEYQIQMGGDKFKYTATLTRNN